MNKHKPFTDTHTLRDGMKTGTPLHIRVSAAMMCLKMAPPSAGLPEQGGKFVEANSPCFFFFFFVFAAFFFRTRVFSLRVSCDCFSLSFVLQCFCVRGVWPFAGCFCMCVNMNCSTLCFCPLVSALASCDLAKSRLRRISTTCALDAMQREVVASDMNPVEGHM